MIVRFVNPARDIEDLVVCFLDVNSTTGKDVHDALQVELDVHVFYFAECEGYDNGANIIRNNALCNQGY